MGHLTSKDAYKTLDQRLNLFPQGAPPSESLIFDNQAFANHRALAQVLGVILRLPRLAEQAFTEAEEIRCCKDVPFRF